MSAVKSSETSFADQFFGQSLADSDPVLWESMQNELKRQQQKIDLQMMFQMT